MGIRKIIAYGAIALTVLLPSVYSGVALSQNIKVPKDAPTYVGTGARYSPPVEFDLKLQGFPLTKKDAEDAAKTFVLNQSVLMEAKAKAMEASSSYSIANSEVSNSFQSSSADIANNFLKYQQRAQDLTKSLFPTPQDFALDAITRGVYSQVKTLGVFLEGVNMLNEMSSSIGQIGKEVRSGQVSEPRRQAVASGYNSLLGESISEAIAYFTMLEGSPLVNGDERKFFEQVASKGTLHPIDVNQITSNVGYTLKVKEGGKLLSVKRIQEPVVRNSSGSFHSYSTGSIERETGKYSTVRNTSKETINYVEVEEDEDPIRFVWAGPEMVSSSAPSSKMFNGDHSRNFIQRDDFYYQVQGFPVRESDLKKYFKQHGYKLPQEVGVVTIELNQQRLKVLQEIRNQAKSSCPNVIQTRRMFNKLEEEAKFSIKGHMAVSGDLGNLESLCTWLFSFNLAPPFVFTFQKTASTVESLPEHPEIKTYIVQATSNLSNNMQTLQAQIVQENLLNKKVASEELKKLRDSLNENTGNFTRRLGGYSRLTEKVGKILGLIDTTQHVRILSYPPSVGNDGSVLYLSLSVMENDLQDFLSSKPYKFLRLAERTMPSKSK